MNGWKLFITIISAVSLVIFSGCNNAQPEPAAPNEPQVNSQPQSPVGVHRFQPNQQEQTAVESALELSKKYSELVDKAADLRQQNVELMKENHQLQNQLTRIETEYEQTQQELTEANDMLLEMRVELNNWKTDILGFRDEMREAQKAQLDTLMMILEMLGGEIPEIE